MKATSWVQINFDAGHRAGYCQGMPETHGHRWSVRAYLSEPYEPDKPSRVDLLREALVDIRGEIHGTMLDAMLLGVKTTPAGIAAWVLERIPAASAVEVSQDADAAVRVER